MMLKTVIENKQSQLKNYAINSALTSDYARRTYDFIPTWILSYILRTFIDFVLFYRFYTRYYFVNMFMAVIVSVAVTIASPFFYDIVWQYKDHIQKFTDHVVRNMSWNYYFKWKNRIVLTSACVIIAILYMDWIVVTNWWIIECIIHTLVCGFILGKYDEVKEYVSKPKQLEYTVANEGAPQFIQIVHLPLRQVRVASANLNECFLPHSRPTMKAKKIVIRNEKVVNNTSIDIFGGMKIINDYSGKKM